MPLDANRLCGCACPEALEVIAKAILSDEYTSEPAAQALRVMLDAVGWREHGVSVRGGWPTDEGRQVAKLLGMPECQDCGGFGGEGDPAICAECAKDRESQGIPRDWRA